MRVQKTGKGLLLERTVNRDDSSVDSDSLLADPLVAPAGEGLVYSWTLFSLNYPVLSAAMLASPLAYIAHLPLDTFRHKASTLLALVRNMFVGRCTHC